MDSLKNSALAVRTAPFPFQSFILLLNFSIRVEVGLLSKNKFAGNCKSKESGNTQNITFYKDSESHMLT